MTSEVSRSIFLDAYSETLGRAKAESLFSEVTTAAKLNNVEIYTFEEAQLILDKLQDKGGLIRIVSMNIQSRLLLRGIFH